MKRMQMFAAAALSLSAFMATVTADGVTLKVDQIKQRYPWNGLVDIDYTITDDDTTPGIDDNLEVLMVDHDVLPAVTNRAITFLQAPLPLTAGMHRITWDANADGVTSRIDKAEFVMKIAHYGEVYMVIDVSGGSATNCYPVDFLNGAPHLGFNFPEYKGNKIVLRRIHPGSYMAGSPGGEANRTAAREKQHRVALSQPFYIGIFEITQQQYLNVMGGTNPSSYKDDDNWQYRPVETVTWNTVRGGTWPNGNPASDSFMDKLIQKCKSKDPSTGEYTVTVEGFDLPTEYQWEYACRAGTTGALNTTNSFNNGKSTEQEAELELLGRYAGNVSKGAGGISIAHTLVGSYLPNAWGLYDMHGNVFEWCLDWYAEDPTALNPRQYRDPVGKNSTSGSRLLRGGAWTHAISFCRSASRSYAGPATKANNDGFRLSRTLP